MCSHALGLGHSPASALASVVWLASGDAALPSMGGVASGAGGAASPGDVGADASCNTGLIGRSGGLRIFGSSGPSPSASRQRPEMQNRPSRQPPLAVQAQASSPGSQATAASAPLSGAFGAGSLQPAEPRARAKSHDPLARRLLCARATEGVFMVAGCMRVTWIQPSTSLASRGAAR